MDSDRSSARSGGGHKACRVAHGPERQRLIGLAMAWLELAGRDLSASSMEDAAWSIAGGHSGQASPIESSTPRTSATARSGASRWRILTGGGQGALAGVRVTMRCVSSHFNGQTSTIIRHSGTFGKAVSGNWRGCADTPHLN